MFSLCMTLERRVLKQTRNMPTRKQTAGSRGDSAAEIFHSLSFSATDLH